MCMQCSAEAETLKEGILPGYTLMRSTKATHDWPLGWYGLVECNDPLFVFKGPLRRDPCDGLTEDDLTAMPSYPDGYDEYAELAEELTQVEIGGLVDTYKFVKACMDVGYNPATHGTQIGYWLGHYLATQIEAS